MPVHWEGVCVKKRTLELIFLLKSATVSLSISQPFTVCMAGVSLLSLLSLVLAGFVVEAFPW